MAKQLKDEFKPSTKESKKSKKGKKGKLRDITPEEVSFENGPPQQTQGELETAAVETPPLDSEEILERGIQAEKKVEDEEMIVRSEDGITDQQNADTITGSVQDVINDPWDDVGTKGKKPKKGKKKNQNLLATIATETPAQTEDISTTEPGTPNETPEIESSGGPSNEDFSVLERKKSKKREKKRQSLLQSAAFDDAASEQGKEAEMDEFSGATSEREMSVNPPKPDPEFAEDKDVSIDPITPVIDEGETAMGHPIDTKTVEPEIVDQYDTNDNPPDAVAPEGSFEEFQVPGKKAKKSKKGRRDLWSEETEDTPVVQEGPDTAFPAGDMDKNLTEDTPLPEQEEDFQTSSKKSKKQKKKQQKLLLEEAEETPAIQEDLDTPARPNDVGEDPSNSAEAFVPEETVVPTETFEEFQTSNKKAKKSKKKQQKLLFEETDETPVVHEDPDATITTRKMDEDSRSPAEVVASPEQGVLVPEETTAPEQIVAPEETFEEFQASNKRSKKSKKKQQKSLFEEAEENTVVQEDPDASFTAREMDEDLRSPPEVATPLEPEVVAPEDTFEEFQTSNKRSKKPKKRQQQFSFEEIEESPVVQEDPDAARDIDEGLRSPTEVAAPFEPQVVAPEDTFEEFQTSSKKSKKSKKKQQKLQLEETEAIPESVSATSEPSILRDSTSDPVENVPGSDSYNQQAMEQVTSEEFAPVKRKASKKGKEKEKGRTDNGDEGVDREIAAEENTPFASLDNEVQSPNIEMTNDSWDQATIQQDPSEGASAKARPDESRNMPNEELEFPAQRKKKNKKKAQRTPSFNDDPPVVEPDLKAALESPSADNIDNIPRSAGEDIQMQDVQASGDEIATVEDGSSFRDIADPMKDVSHEPSKEEPTTYPERTDPEDLSLEHISEGAATSLPVDAISKHTDVEDVDEFPVFSRKRSKKEKKRQRDIASANLDTPEEGTYLANESNFSETAMNSKEMHFDPDFTVEQPSTNRELKKEDENGFVESTKKSKKSKKRNKAANAFELDTPTEQDSQLNVQYGEIAEQDKGQGKVSPPMDSTFSEPSDKLRSSDEQLEDRGEVRPNEKRFSFDKGVVDVLDTQPLNRSISASESSSDFIQHEPARMERNEDPSHHRQEKHFDHESTEDILSPVSGKFSRLGAAVLPAVKEEEDAQFEDHKFELGKPQHFHDLGEPSRDSGFVTDSPVVHQTGFSDYDDRIRDSGVHLRESSPITTTRLATSSVHDSFSRGALPLANEREKRTGSFTTREPEDGELAHQERSTRDVSSYRHSPPPSTFHEGKEMSGELHGERDKSGLHRSRTIRESPSSHHLRHEKSIRDEGVHSPTPETPKLKDRYPEIDRSIPKARRPHTPMESAAAGLGGAGIVAAGLAALQAKHSENEEWRPESAQSSQSRRSSANINRLRTPDPKFRPESTGSLRSLSSGTPPLRRMDRKWSGDLRSLSQQSREGQLSSQQSKPELAKEAPSTPTPILQPANPTANEAVSASRT